MTVKKATISIGDWLKSTGFSAEKTLSSAQEQRKNLLQQMDNANASYLTGENRGALQRAFSNYQATMNVLRGAGYDTGNDVDVLRRAVHSSFDFQNQFKDEDDFNVSYAYPKKYKGKTRADVDAALTQLKNTPGAEAEYDWLNKNQMNYWSADELKAQIGAWQNEISGIEQQRRNMPRMAAGSTDADYAKRQQEALALSGQIDERKAKIGEAQSLLTKKTYDDEISKWDTQMQKALSDYSKALSMSESANTEMAMAGNSAFVVQNSDYATNARNTVRSFEQQLRDYGYSDQQINGIRNYALTQQHANEAAEMAQQVAQEAKEHPWLSSAMSVGTNMMAGAGALDIAAQNALNGTDPFTGEKMAVDRYTKSMVPSTVTNTIRGSVSEDMSGIGSFLYNNGMSMADTISTMVLEGATGLRGASEAILSGAAASQAITDAYDRGASDKEAVSLGVLYGAAEALFEHISLDKLRMFHTSAAAGKKTAKTLVKDMLKQSFVEGSEEVCTDIANVISDAIVMADKSEINQTIAAYQADGMSEDEATRRAWLDWLGQTAQDFAGGAISGGVITGGDMALNAGMRSANYRETGRQITANDYADILRHAAEESGDENLRKLAGKKQTNRNTGKLYEATQEANLTQAVSDRLGALGAPENDVQELTGLVVKQIKGQELTGKEQRKFDASKQAQRAASEYASLFTRDADRTTNAWARSHMRDAAELERNAIYGGARKTDARQTKAHQAEKNAEVQVNGETAQVQALRYDQESGSVELSVKGKNGDVQRVSVKDAKLPEGTRLLAESAEKYGDTAPQMYANYKNGQDVERYASAYEVAYSYGRARVKNYAVLENSGAASYLTPEQRKFAYETGLAAARRESDAKSAAAKSSEIHAGSVTLEGGKLGSVTLAAVNTAGLTRKQAASIDVARKVAEATGVNVVFFESQTGEDGKYLGMNGAYRDGTIYLDVNAGKNNVDTGETAILKTMSHELTHFIQQNGGQYESLKEFVANHVLESGDSIERLARQKLDNDSTGELTMDGAMDEVVADACEMMLRNTEAVQRLANENRSLAEKIRDWIGDFVKKLRAAFKGDRATHDEARAMLDRMVELQKLWDDALVDAAKANAAKENTAGDGGVQEQARQAYESKNLAEDSEVYDYDFLTSLPDMRITELPEVPMIRDAGGKVNSAAVITEGMKNARSVGGERGGKIYVKNAYTGRQLRIDTSSIRHGLNGGINRLLTNARLGAVIGNVVQNAVPVNALYNKAKGVTGTYAMVAYANDSRNREFVAIVTVEQRSGDISGLESYDVTHAVSGRQKNSSQADTKSQGVYPIKAAKISIADFLSIVNSTHQSILSDDVLQHFGETRNLNGDYSGQVKFSLRDSAGNALTAEQQEFFKDSQVRDDDGRLLVMYHQTEGAFTVFDTRHKGAGTRDDETPFGIFMKTSSRDIGISGKKQMELYANIKSPLRVNDRAELVTQLRRMSEKYAQLKDQSEKIDKEYSAKFAEAKNAFQNFLLQWRKENPDAPSRAAYDAEGFDAAFDAEDVVVKEWTQKKDGLALRAKDEITKALRANGYDGVILENDRGSFGRSTDAYIALDANQVKNTTNKAPTNDADIRFSEREYTYEALTAKPDMRVTNVDDRVPYRPTREARKEIVARAIENAKKIGRTNENGNAVVRVADTGDEVILSAKGLRHGLDRRFSVNAPVTLKAGEIIRNAIRINEFTPENAQMDASYALIGAAKNAKNEPYIVQFVVNRISNEVTDVDVLYAVNAKTESAGSLSPEITGLPATLTDSAISIRSLLDYVNRYFSDVLPESVLRYYNHDRRPEGKLGESALYQRRDDTRTDRDVLSDAADGDAANVREMEMLREYREKLREYTSASRRLEKQRQIALTATDKSERTKAANRANNAAQRASKLDEQLTRMQNAKPLRELVARELKTRDSLAKENAMLRDRVEYWRGQTHTTEEATTDPKAVREAAKDIIKQTGSSIDADEVTGRLQELYDGIARATSENGLSQENIWKRAYDLAHDILDDVSVRDDMMYQEYSDLRAYFRNTQITLSSAMLGDFTDFGDFRRRNYGRMKLKKGEHGNVDQIYEEAATMWPGLFDSERVSHPGDQLREIDDVLNRIYTIDEYNPNDRYMHQAAQSVANEIIEQFFDTPEQKTFADRQAAKLLKQKGENIQKIRELREENRKRLQQVRRDARKEMTQHKRKWEKAASQKTKDQIKTSKLRIVIETKANRLSDWLLKNSDKEHIPEPLKLALGEFLESIDFTSRRALRGGEPTAKDAKRARRYTDRMQKLLDSLRRQNDDGTNDLGLYLDLPDGFLEEMQTHISIASDITSQNPGESPVSKMKLEQLQQLDRMLTILTRSIQNANKLKANAHFETARQAAQATVQELERLGQAKGRTKVGDKVANFFNWENTTPYYAFQRFGEGGKAIFEALSSGWDKMAFNTKAVMGFTEQTYKPEEVKAWSKETHTFKLESGESVKMTTAQMMAFYCLSKREQAAGHLLGGGMRVEDIQNSGRKENVKQPDPFLLTQEDIAAINGALTKRQREVADKLQKYMNDQGGAWGNRVSMERFGYRAFTEENYFPIETMDSNRDAKDPGAKENDMFRLLNMSATKSLVYKANNALVVRDIFDVFSNHMADMAKYDALALPILDAMKWYNYREKQKLENGHVLTTTVQRSIEKAYGMDANKYFTTFIKDLNGVNEGGRGEGFAKKMLSNYKVAAVAANLRVALLQPTAYVRAVGVMNPKYLAKGFSAKSGYKEAETHSGIALWKQMGFYDTNIGMNIRDQIKNAGTWEDSTVEFLMKGAEWGDRLTWGRLWNACKAEVRDKQKLTGDALLKATAERFREVVYSTQVVDSTMTRSQAMRGKSVYGSISTAFMSEPTLSYNLVLKAYTDYTTELRTTGDKKKAWNNAKGKVAWALATYLVSAAASGLVESAVDACRDDDEYATWLEKYLNALIGANYEEGKFSGVRPFDNNLFSDVDILSKLPILKDFMSMISGYGNDRMDTEWISNLIDAYRIWDETIKLETGELDEPTDVTYNGNMTLYGKIYKTLKAVSQATGLPISAASREVVTLWNTIAGAAGKGDEWTIHTYDSGPENQIKYGLRDGYLTREEAQQLLVEKGLADNEDDAYWKVDKWATGEGKYDKALAAVLSGDKAAFDAQAKELKEHGIGEKQLQSKVRSQTEKWYVGDDDGKRSITKEQALKILQQYGGKDADEAQKLVQKWTCEVVTGTDYDDIKDLYLDGKLTRSRAVDMLVRYGGMTQEDAQNKIDTADFVKAHPECDGISVEAVQKYNEQAKPAGLDAGTFWEAYQFKNDARTTRDSNGKAISGQGAMDKVAAYIDGLNISSAQKSALFLCFYSQTSLNKIRWSN